MIGIYGFQNQLNQKWYIGQSIHIEHRQKEHKNEMLSNRSNNKFYNALRKYGWENFSFQILEECSPEELNSKEVYWIKYYNSYLNGYNSTPGGQEKYFNPQPIYEAWDEGLSPLEISQKLNIGISCVRKNLSEYSNYSVKEAYTRGKKLALKNKNSTVYQYDLNGNFIQSWPSCKEIARQTGYDDSAIGRCIKNKRLSAYNYQWKNFYQKKIPKIPNAKGKAISIIQCDLEGNELKIFNSIKEAAQAINGDDSAIRKTINKSNRTAYGYKWKTLN